MQATYNEEELLLRLLLGLVFPFLMLVALRMTRLGLRKWENRWRRSARVWFAALYRKRNAPDAESLARRTISFLLGLERTLVFGFQFLVLSVLWFVLFPQTRPLALQLVESVIAPVLGFIAKAMGGFVLVLYSIALLFGAVFLTRLLSERTRKTPLRGVLSNPIFLFPMKAGIWLLALFLFLFPYPGVARLFAVGILIAALLILVLAFRPIIEEIAVGIFLTSSLGLRKGKELKIGDRYFPVAELRSIHVLVIKDGETICIPYSVVLRSESASRDPSGEPDGN